MSPPDLPPGTPDNFAWFASWISEQFGKIEGKIDSLTREFITRREFERMQIDIDRAHKKLREHEQGPFDELEDRVAVLENKHSVTVAVSEGRWTMGEKILGAVYVLMQLAVTAFLGLRG
jgi:hypothetical protein